MNTEPKQQKAVVRRKRARPTESARQPEQVSGLQSSFNLYFILLKRKMYFVQDAI